MGRWALIKTESEISTVQDVIVADAYNAHKISTAKGYDEPVDVEWWPVQAGDTYSGGGFYRDGVTIQKTLTPDEKIQLVGIENTDRDLENLELGQYATELDLRLIALESV